MKKEWLNAFSRMTCGIYVLTVRTDDAMNGMIASWVTPVSYDPLLIAVAIHPNRYSHHLIMKSRAFALHVLDRSQKSFLKKFKGPLPEDKFSGLNIETGKTGAPILKDCPAWFELKVKESYDPGNHTLFIGEVINSGLGPSGISLCTLDYNGMYTGEK